MTRYAEGTNVSVDRSKAELEKLLQKYGATRFVSGWDQQQLMVGFEMNHRQVKLLVPIPSKDDPAIKYTPSGAYQRSERGIAQEWQGAIRQRWRALVLIVKAKLEAVAEGITTFDEEFLGNLMLQDGRTVAEVVLPHLADLPNALPARSVPTDTGGERP